MANIFNKLTFKKLTPGKAVASKGGKVFKKISMDVESQAPPVIQLSSTNFDLNILVAFGLRHGTHTFRATSLAPDLGLAESEYSNSVEFKVE